MQTSSNVKYIKTDSNGKRFSDIVLKMSFEKYASSYASPSLLLMFSRL